ncbi:MAG: carbohydrate ABC transporter permease [Eubacteriales bacterium]|nr:carbohydrate ABC transporter permease [Eubacteriales bacterium]
MSRKEKRTTVICTVIIVVMAVIMIFPFFLVILNSFKSMNEIGINVMAIPKEWRIGNYLNALKRMNFFKSLQNTVIVTLIGNAGLILCASMTGYWLCRNRKGINGVIYFMFLSAMAIPFQATMIPFVKVMNIFGLNGSLSGTAIAYWGMCCPTVIFLTEGTVKSIPIEMEEAASIDGCSKTGVYFRVVFPNLKNIVVTFTIMNVFYIWNDYLLPFLMLGVNKKSYTIQIALKVFSGEYGVRWDYMLPGVVLAMIIPVIIFIFCQRMIIEGMVSGSVKG